jgi:long-chain acyl-CoA synthetase
MKGYQITQSRPWFRFWPEGVPQHLTYPVVPLFELLSRVAKEQPAGVAFSFRERALCYKELNEMTGRLAAGLYKLGVRPGDRVALFLPNSLEFVIGYYGILKAGATVTMVNPLYKQGELKYQLNDTAAVSIITSSAQYPLVREVQAETSLKMVVLTDTGIEHGAVHLAQLLAEHFSTPPGLPVNPGEDIAVIAYTGGTAGLPKGVLLTHYNLVANAMQNAIWFGWTHRNTIIGILPFFIAGGVAPA